MSTPAVRATALALALATLLLPAAASARPAYALPAINVLSNRADMVSGADALVSIEIADEDLDKATVRLNGKDITDTFPFRADGRLEGLVTGLEIGDNKLKVE